MMPRTEEVNQLIRETQRAKILEAARKVFSHMGWSATMADIAGAAEVSQGLAYRYFSNKESIFSELAENAIQSSQTALQRISKMPGTPWERISFLITKILENKQELLGFFQFFYQNKEKSNDLYKPFLNQKQNLQNILTQLIIEGQSSGEVTEGDPEQLVVAVIACIDGLSKFALNSPEKFKMLFPDAKIILKLLKP
jgi:AcrR family transcriptional regulator